MAQRPVRLPVVEVPQEPEIVPEQREQPEAAIPQRQGPDLEVLCLFSLFPCVLISHSLPGFLVVFLIPSTFILWLCILCSRTFISNFSSFTSEYFACVLESFIILIVCECTYRYCL